MAAAFRPTPRPKLPPTDPPQVLDLAGKGADRAGGPAAAPIQPQPPPQPNSNPHHNPILQVLDLANKGADLAGLTARVSQLLECLEGPGDDDKRGGGGGGGSWPDGSGSDGGGGGGGKRRREAGRAEAPGPAGGGGTGRVKYVTLRWDEGGAAQVAHSHSHGSLAGAAAAVPGSDTQGQGPAEGALRPLPPWSGATLRHERFAGAAALLAPPRLHASLAGGRLEVSLHSLGAGALQRRVADVFPDAPPGAALLAAVTFQSLGPAPGSGGGGSGHSSSGGDRGGGDGSGFGAQEMQRALETFLAWAAAVRGFLKARWAARARAGCWGRI
jgi:hypothetical protein